MKTMNSAVLALLVASAFIVGGDGYARAETRDNAEKRDLVITRVFDAPVEVVWKAWTDPEHVMRWWGPTGFTSPTCK